MDKPNPGHQEVLRVTVEDLLSRLVQFGELQVVTRRGGIVHEQFGTFLETKRAANRFTFAGRDHFTALNPAEVGRIVVNRLGGTTAMPQARLDLLDQNNEILFSVLGGPDPAPFQAMVDGLERRPLPELNYAVVPDAVAITEDHPGTAPLRAAGRSHHPVTVEFELPGVRSSWTGVVRGFQLGPRNINIMQDDFHLHLKGGAIADWTARDIGSGRVEQSARDASGAELGLRLRGPAEIWS